MGAAAQAKQTYRKWDEFRDCVALPTDVFALVKVRLGSENYRAVYI